MIDQQPAQIDIEQAIANRTSSVSLPDRFEWLTEIRPESEWLANFPSINTRRNYTIAVRQFVDIQQIHSPAQLYKVKPAHVIDFRDHLNALGQKPRTIRQKVAAISSLFDHLVVNQCVLFNPCKSVKRPKVAIDHGPKTPAIPPLKVREILGVPDTATYRGLRDAALLHVFFFTGARVSEIASLRLIDFIQHGNYWTLNFPATKGGYEHRIAISHKCQLAISAYLAERSIRSQIRAISTDHQHPEPQTAPLFLSAKKGNYCEGITASGLGFFFSQYVSAVGLPDNIYSPHSARATFITQAHRRTQDPKAIQATVGHRHLNTTDSYIRAEANLENSASLTINY